jgi:hypothetical protein
MCRLKGAIDMETLVSTDRCDRCGAQAYVRVNNGELELDFCGHHYTKLAEDLDSQGFMIAIDTRDLLTRRAVGAEVS